MRLTEARKAGAKFYNGKVCEYHPELKGQRRAKNGRCVKCIRDYNRERAAALRRANEKATSAIERAGG